MHISLSSLYSEAPLSNLMKSYGFFNFEGGGVGPWALGPNIPLEISKNINKSNVFSHSNLCVSCLFLTVFVRLQGPSLM